MHQVLLEVETGNNFMVSVQDNVRTKRSIHLRAKNTAERAEWIHALEHAKVRAASPDVSGPACNRNSYPTPSRLTRHTQRGVTTVLRRRGVGGGFYARPISLPRCLEAAASSANAL